MNRRLRSVLAPVLTAAALAPIPSAAQQPIPPFDGSIELGRDDNVVRDIQDYGALNVNLNGWDMGLAYSTETPDFAPAKNKFTLNVGKDFGFQRFSAAVQQGSGVERNELGGHLFWEYGQKDDRRFGFEGAYKQRDFDNFIVDSESQIHARLFYGLRNGTEFSVFMNDKATPDIMGDQKTFIRLPRSTIVGQKTVADVNLGEDLVEDSVGASVKFSGERTSGLVYAKQGDQYVRGIPEPDTFLAYGGNINRSSKHVVGHIDLDIRDAETFNGVPFNEARLFIDGKLRRSGAELGFGAYSRGISAKLDQNLFTGFYDTAGGGFSFSGKFHNGGKAGFWAMAEDNAAHKHTILRGGIFAGTKNYEFGVGGRVDNKGMTRFKTTENGYFVTVKTPHGGGLLGVQAGEPYGDVSLSLRRKQTDDNQLAFLGNSQDTVFSLLPNGDKIEPGFLHSNVSVDFGSGRNTGALFSKQSSVKTPNQQIAFATKETGIRHRYDGNSITLETTLSFREIPSIGFAEPTGSSAAGYTIGKNTVGLGVVMDQQFTQGKREATFAFWKRDLGNLLLENALGIQNGGAFASFNVGLSTGGAKGALLPGYLLPPLPMRSIVAAINAAAMLGPQRLYINVHNGGQWSRDQDMPFLRQIKSAISGVRINPMYTCLSNVEFTDECTKMVASDPYLDAVLDEFGSDGVIVLVARDLTNNIKGTISPRHAYMRLKNVLMYDERIVNAQFGGESLNSENQTPEQIARVYGPVARQAADEVNLIRPPNRKVFLLDDGAFGGRTGIRQNHRKIRAGSLPYFDGVTCHIYTNSKEEAVRRAKECLIDAHGKPVSFTETNWANGGEFSRYDKHVFWVRDVMSAIEREAEKYTPPNLLNKQFNVFYTLRAHETAQFNFMEWNEATQRLQPTASGLYDFLMQRVAAANAVSSVAATIAPSPSAPMTNDPAWNDAMRGYSLHSPLEKEIEK